MFSHTYTGMCQPAGNMNVLLTRNQVSLPPPPPIPPSLRLRRYKATVKIYHEYQGIACCLLSCISIPCLSKDCVMNHSIGWCMVHGTPTRCEGFSRFVATLLSIRRETEINFPPVRLYRALPSPISLFISHLLELKTFVRSYCWRRSTARGRLSLSRCRWPCTQKLIPSLGLVRNAGAATAQSLKLVISENEPAYPRFISCDFWEKKVWLVN